MKFKVYLTLALVVLTNSLINAQDIEYSYDNAGNRIKKQEIVLKSAAVPEEFTSIYNQEKKELSEIQSLVLISPQWNVKGHQICAPDRFFPF